MTREDGGGPLPAGFCRPAARAAAGRLPGFRAAPWILLAVLVAAGCADDQTADLAGPDRAAPAAAVSSAADQVRSLAAARGIVPLPPPPSVRPALARLGQMLMFDPILSGNRDIACMTCHVPALATGDGRSLAIGQGGSGLGPARVHPGGRFIPRNAPPLFNLHLLDSFFWDGRVFADARGHFRSSIGPQVTGDMSRTFEFGALSAVGLLPVLSREEMRGVSGNELAVISDAQAGRIWRALMRRLGGIEEYRELFEAAYPGTPFERMTFAHASNAMAGFMIARLTFSHSPWDRFLAGEDDALNPAELEGARTFMQIRCSLCHNGPAFTDGAFHNVALAQFGPGEGDGSSGADDFGRARVTGAPEDRYTFRTTPLRNVELTGPYGHAGQFASLRDFVDHYSESDLKLRQYDGSQLEPLLRPTLLDNVDAVLATRDTIIDGVVLAPEVVDALTAYLNALTDPAARDLRHLIPAQVPSGLPVGR